MEFEINIQHGLNGHVEIEDLSKNYDQYSSEDIENTNVLNKFKYSQSASINVINNMHSVDAHLMDVFLDDHSKDRELLVFDLPEDGYYTVTHFVLPTNKWLVEQIRLDYDNLTNYDTIYYVQDQNIYKRYFITKEQELVLSDPIEVSIRELLERNKIGTTIQSCNISIFYTGFLKNCYINYCQDIFNDLMKNCNPNCVSKKVDTFNRDFAFMTLNILEYLSERGQYMEAQRLLEKIQSCGGICNEHKKQLNVGCGCNRNVTKKSCGCS